MSQSVSREAGPLTNEKEEHICVQLVVLCTETGENSCARASIGQWIWLWLESTKAKSNTLYGTLSLIERRFVHA